MVMSFIVQRPSHEPGFGLQRTEEHGRTVRYTTHSYAATRPAGQRYG
jgi:ribulose-bisphosphate carboxylase small chain